MTISVFENRFDGILTFILEPKEERYELPPGARIGVRYSFETSDRTFAHCREREIRYWCDSEQRDVEIIHPSSFDLLLTDICVRDGFCGGIVDGQPMHVTDLLPANGAVTAEEFANLVIRAEGDGNASSPRAEQWIKRLEAQFVKHMGQSSVPAETLVQNLAQPFDP